MLSIALVVFLVLGGRAWPLPVEIVALTAIAAVILAGALRPPETGAPQARACAARIARQALRGAGLLACAGLLVEHLAAEPRIALLQPPAPWVVLAGGVLTVSALIEVRRHLGTALVVIVALFVAYALLGDRLEGALGHGAISPAHFVDLMFFTTDGILGTPLAVATGTVVHFLLLATLLERLGAIEVFCRLSAWLTGGRLGGPASTAVVASGLFGTISGSPTSDVAATGSVTIPAMRAAGYPAHKAAAVEVAASTGGSILPPVMGTASFIMAEFTGLAYAEVILAALIPALLYYGALWLGILLDSRRHGVPAGMAGPEGPMLQPGLVVLAAGSALIGALVWGHLPSTGALAGTGVALVLGLVLPGLRLTPADLAWVLATAGRRLMPVLAACLAAGVLIGCVTMTGLTGKAAWLILSGGQGLFMPTLLLAAVAALVFGMGMPTTGAYILGATLLAPALVELGIGLLPAHLFVFYFAVLSAMTPPLAVAAFTAVAIAGGSPYRVGLRAMRYGVAAFVLPFAFVFHGELLMTGPPLAILAETARAALALAALTLALEGGALGIRATARVLLLAGGPLLLTPMPVVASLGALCLAGAAADRLRARASLSGWRNDP